MPWIDLLVALYDSAAFFQIAGRPGKHAQRFLKTEIGYLVVRKATNFS